MKRGLFKVTSIIAMLCLGLMIIGCGKNEEKYTIGWEDYDGSILEIDRDVPYGDMPKYDGPKPTRTASNFYEYEFNGWSPFVRKVSGNITYRATYNEKLIDYTISYTNTMGVKNNNPTSYNSETSFHLIDLRKTG